MLKMPAKYKSILSPRETEHAIVAIKDFFQLALSTELNLYRVTAPLFVESGTGINDDLNGVERPVSFPVKDFPYSYSVNGKKTNPPYLLGISCYNQVLEFIQI